MSRIGRKPIMLPDGVSVTVAGREVRVTGPRGVLVRTIRPEVAVRVDGKALSVQPLAASRRTPAYWGLTRSLIAGMVEGVSQGFERQLEVAGIGYRVSLDGSALQLAIGFSQPVKVTPPPGIAFRIEKNVVTVSGIDKELVGTIAARIRALKPAEPYKGKGIRYAGEVVRRKVGKKAAAAK